MGISITNTIYLGKATPSSAGGSHNLGWYATPEALQTAHPTGNNGDWAQVGTTDTVWIWDSDTSAWVDSGNTDSANKNLSNLTSVGANMSNWSTNASNCIAEIPQDINLTLSSGTLTLKAGSKVYVPNGAGVFNAVIIDSDKTFTNTTNGQYLVFYNSLNSSIVAGTLAQVGSGTPDSSTWGFFYDTTENRIDFYNPAGTRNDRYFALPLCLITVSNGAISSIDQVFNGFGFIGNTVYALPGAKCLIPDGFNENGTVKSKFYTTTKVSTRTITASGNFVVVSDGTINASSVYEYSAKTNYVYNTSTGANYTDRCLCGYVSYSGGAITKLTTNLPFRAVDYSDTDFIAHQAMPSERYINVTLPASGSTVTAPADGYYIISKANANSSEYLYMINNITYFNIGIYPQGGNGRLFMPVSKGDVITITYTLTGSTNFFRFVYANGSK